MRQSERLSRLLELLKTRRFSSHQALLAALETQGVLSTQASLSRDLHRLGVQKVHGVYQLEAPGAEILIEPAGPHLLVLKTTPGAASAMAAEIDRLSLEGLVGTVAGDDTIFIATKDLKAQNQIHRALLEQLV